MTDELRQLRERVEALEDAVENLQGDEADGSLAVLVRTPNTAAADPFTPGTVLNCEIVRLSGTVAEGGGLAVTGSGSHIDVMVFAASLPAQVLVPAVSVDDKWIGFYGCY